MDALDPPRPSLRSDTSPKGRGKGACRFAGGVCKICGCIPPGGQRRPPLQGVVRGRRWRVQFCDCVLRGRGRTPPLRNGDRFCVFALVYSNLQVRTAQSFRHGFAVPPPFTQGRLCVVQTRGRSEITTLPLISRLCRQLPLRGEAFEDVKSSGNFIA